MSKPTANFRDLRASLESRSKPTTATAYRSIAGDLANMSPQQPGKIVPSLARSIDSVLDTSPAPPAARPPLARLRPSWIGPPPSERPQTPGIQAMKQSVVIEYSSPGLQPPVYICTSLSEPQWDPIEMHCEPQEYDSFRFSKSFQVEEGEYQYKFRLGAGDWWVCDESKPTVDDGQGNKNNLLEVKPQSILTAIKPQSDAVSHVTQITEQLTAGKAPTAVPLPQLPVSRTTAEIKRASLTVPGVQNEETHTSKDTSVKQIPAKEAPHPLADDDEEGHDVSHTSMPLKHESFDRLVDEDTDSDNGDSDSYSDDEDVGEKGKIDTPLLRHETFIKPLAKESLSNGSPVAEAVKLPAKVLVKFPTHHAGIIEMISHTQKRLPEDDTSDEDVDDSPESQAVSDCSKQDCPLPRIHEVAEEAMLQKIREAEEDEFKKEEADGDELDPLMSSANHQAPEPEDADFEPKVNSIIEKVKIEERIIIEVQETRQTLVDSLLDNVGGRGNAIAMVVGLLVIAAGICTLQFL